jgi:hypothetical protein
MPYWAPLESEEPTIGAEFLQEIGRVIMNWAWLEHLLIADIQTLRRLIKPDVLTTEDNEIPRAFSRRLSLWAKLARTVYSSVPHYLEKVQLIQQSALNLSKDRNLLIHGLFQRWESAGGGMIEVVNLQPKGAGIALSRHRVDFVGMQQIAKNIKMICDEISALSLNAFILGTHRIKTQPSHHLSVYAMGC